MKHYFKLVFADKKGRRDARWSILEAWAKRGGFNVYRPHLAWQDDAEFLGVQKAWGKVPGAPNDRRFFLFDLARRLRDVPGETADIGVRFGASTFYLLSGLNQPGRPHHVFDSFEGLSEPTPEDAANGEAKRWAKGKLAVDEQVTRKNLEMFPNVSYYKGWIPERYNEVADRRFAFVHIDVDLYQPTKDSLDFFYERMNPGGAILCDDYGFSTCPGVRKAMDDFFAERPETLLNIPSGHSLIIKR
jgi:O-methyltransferase